MLRQRRHIPRPLRTILHLKPCDHRENQPTGAELQPPGRTGLGMSLFPCLSLFPCSEHGTVPLQPLKYSFAKMRSADASAGPCSLEYQLARGPSLASAERGIALRKGPSGGFSPVTEVMKRQGKIVMGEECAGPVRQVSGNDLNSMAQRLRLLNHNHCFPRGLVRGSRRRGKHEHEVPTRSSSHSPRGSSGRVTRKAVLRRAWHDRCSRGIPSCDAVFQGLQGNRPMLCDF